MSQFPQFPIKLGKTTGWCYNFRVIREALFVRWLSALDPEIEYGLTIAPMQKLKTNDQMAWYRGRILDECLAVINAPLKEEWKLTIKNLDGFFSKQFLTVGLGTKFEGVLSKGSLTAKEFSMFIEQISLYMAENYGYIIEVPDKNWKRKRKKKG
jgi:hypothetical protein